MDSEKRFTKILEDLWIFFFWIYIFVEFEIRNWIISEHDFQFKTPERNIIIYFEFWIQLSFNLFWKSFYLGYSEVGDNWHSFQPKKCKNLKNVDKRFYTISSFSQFKLSCTNTLLNSLIHQLNIILSDSVESKFWSFRW